MNHEQLMNSLFSTILIRTHLTTFKNFKDLKDLIAMMLQFMHAFAF